jgi:N-terminal domain of galactosyltransferase
MQKYSFSFCTSIKNRLSHLQDTLPKNFETFDRILRDNKDVEIEYCISDYDSNDGLHEWLVSSGWIDRIKYKRTENKPFYHMSNGKNVAHKMGSKDILFNLDADNFMSIEYFYHMFALFLRGYDIVSHKETENPETYVQKEGWGGGGGRIGVKRRVFHYLNGYDENLHGWGHEDCDFVNRAVHCGFEVAACSRYLLKDGVILHDDKFRMLNYAPEQRDTGKGKLCKLNREISEKNIRDGIYVANQNLQWGI